MPVCENCGTNLPQNADICHQCGKAVQGSTKKAAAPAKRSASGRPQYVALVGNQKGKAAAPARQKQRTGTAPRRGGSRTATRKKRGRKSMLLVLGVLLVLLFAAFTSWYFLKDTLFGPTQQRLSRLYAEQTLFVGQHTNYEGPYFYANGTEMIGLGYQVEQVAPSADSSVLVYTASEENQEGRTLYWDNITKDERLFICNNPVRYQFLGWHKKLFYLPDDGYLQMYDGNQLSTVGFEVEDFVASPNGEYLLYISQGTLYSVKTGDENPTPVGESIIYGTCPLSISDDGNMIFFAETEGTQYVLKCIDLSRGAAVPITHSVMLPPENGLTLFFNLTGTELFIGNNSGCYLYNTSNGFEQVLPGQGDLLAGGYPVPLYSNPEQGVDVYSLTDDSFNGRYIAFDEGDAGFTLHRNVGGSLQAVAHGAKDYSYCGENQSVAYLDAEGNLYEIPQPKQEGEALEPVTLASDVRWLSYCDTGDALFYFTAPQTGGNGGTYFRYSRIEGTMQIGDGLLANNNMSADGNTFGFYVSYDADAGSGSYATYSFSGKQNLELANIFAFSKPDSQGRFYYYTNPSTYPDGVTIANLYWYDGAKTHLVTKDAVPPA